MIKHHLPRLFVALFSLWIAHVVYANDEATPTHSVAALDDKIRSKQNELDALNSQFDNENKQLQTLKNEQSRIEREHETLDTARNRTKSELDKQYQLLLADPDLDLNLHQKKYQEAWDALKKNQSAQLEIAQSITENEVHLTQFKQKQTRLKSELLNLEESKNQARITRLNAQLRDSGVVEAEHKITCQTSMTLAECANQGQHLTKQKTVGIFRTKLFNELTESNLAKQNSKGVELNIHIQESQVIRSGFEGNSDYFSQIQAQLQAKPEAAAACKLLNLSPRYCVKNTAVTTPSQQTAKKQWATLTVRSDQYDDSVTINGINYGSTPIDVTLPAGRYDISVTKPGHETYHRIITVQQSGTIWAKLAPQKSH